MIAEMVSIVKQSVEFSMKLNMTEFWTKVVLLILTPDQKENCEHIYVDILEQIEVNPIFFENCKQQVI